MRDEANPKALLTGLSMLATLIAAAVVVLLIRPPGDVIPALPETASTDRPVGGRDEDSSRSETVLIAEVLDVVQLGWS